MIKFLSSIGLLFILTTNLVAQNPGPNVTWQKCFSTSMHDSFFATIKHPKGGYLSTMGFQAKDYFLSNDTSRGVYLIRFDDSFNVQWKRKIPLQATKILVLSDYTIVLGGWFNSYSDSGHVFQNYHGLDDLGVMKLDSNAQNVLWANAYGSSGVEDNMYDLIQSDDKGFIFTSETMGCGGNIPPCTRICFNGFSRDATIFKIDSIGNIGWVKLFSGSGDDGCNGSIVQTDSNRYLVTIISASNDCDYITPIPYDPSLGNFKTLHVIVDQNGVEYKRTFDGSGKRFRNMYKSWKKNNKIYAVGISASDLAYSPTYPLHEKLDASIVVLDDSLNLLSQKLFGGKGDDVFVDHCYDNNWNHIFFGITSSSDNNGDVKNYKGGEWDYWILKTDTNFNIIWSKTIGSSGNDASYISTPKDYLINNGQELTIASQTYPPKNLPSGDIECGIYTLNSSFNQYSDAWVFKLDLTTGIEIKPNKYPNTFKLFPNPSSNIITIQNSNPTNKQLTFKIYNDLGAILKEYKFEDYGSASIAITDLDDGIYMVAIQKNKKQLFTQKIVVRK